MNKFERVRVCDGPDLEYEYGSWHFSARWSLAVYNNRYLVLLLRFIKMKHYDLGVVILMVYVKSGKAGCIET